MNKISKNKYLRLKVKVYYRLDDSHMVLFINKPPNFIMTRYSISIDLIRNCFVPLGPVCKLPDW